MSLTRRYPLTSVVAARQQELFANVAVLQFIRANWGLPEIKFKLSGRESWYDGSAGNQIICYPASHGIDRANVMTLGAYFHRRNPVIAIHIFARDAETVDQIRDHIDTMIINNGVNPQEGIQYILPAPIPSLPGPMEEKEAGKTIFHDIIFVEVLYYKNRV